MVNAKSIAKPHINRKGVDAPSIHRINVGSDAYFAPIDMTADTLDSRITYSGPAHYYWNQSGLLALSAANQWPVEYRNGVRQGRHEPEPLINTWQVYNRGNNTSGAPTNNVENPAGTMVNGVGLGPDGGDIATLPLTADSYGISQDIGSIDHVPPTLYGSDLTNQWKRYAFTVTQTAASRMRTWLGRNQASGQPNEYLTQTGQLTARQWVFSWFAKLHPTDNTRFLAGGVMIERENYPYATSPVFTLDQAQNTRAASSVTVAFQGGATGIRVYFTDGTTKDYAFSGNSPITLDMASSHWGTRYITKIEYRTA